MQNPKNEKCASLFYFSLWDRRNMCCAWHLFKAVWIMTIDVLIGQTKGQKLPFVQSPVTLNSTNDSSNAKWWPTFVVDRQHLDRRALMIAGDAFVSVGQSLVWIGEKGDHGNHEQCDLHGARNSGDSALFSIEVGDSGNTRKLRKHLAFSAKYPSKKFRSCLAIVFA